MVHVTGHSRLEHSVMAAKSVAWYYRRMATRFPFFKRTCMWGICACLSYCGPIDSNKNRNSGNEETSKPVMLVPNGRIKICTADEMCLALIDGTIVAIAEGLDTLTVGPLSFDSTLRWDDRRFLLKIGDQVTVSGEINSIGTLWFSDFATAATLLDSNKEFTYQEPTAPTVTGTWSYYTEDDAQPYSTMQFVQLDGLLLMKAVGSRSVAPGRIYEDGSFYFKIRPECCDQIVEPFYGSYSGSFSKSRKSGTLVVKSYASPASESSLLRIIKQE